MRNFSLFLLFAVLAFSACRARKDGAGSSGSSANAGAAAGTSSSSSAESKSSSASGTGKSKHVLDGTWVFESMPGKKFDVKDLFPNQLPEVTFSISAGQLNGFAGCNRFAGKVNINGDKMTISDLALLTRTACPTMGDDAFMGVLQGVTRFVVNGGQLSLYNYNFEMLKLKKGGR